MCHVLQRAAPPARGFVICVAQVVQDWIMKTCSSNFHTRFWNDFSFCKLCLALGALENNILHVHCLTMVYWRSESPPFLATLGQEDPWNEEAVFTRILMHEPESKASFHKVDLFHTVSLGVGKTFAASSFVILQPICDGTSVPSRLQVLTSMYLEFCKEPCFLNKQISLGVDIWVLFFFKVRVGSIHSFAGLPFIFSHLRKTAKRAMWRTLIGHSLGGLGIPSHTARGRRVPLLLPFANFLSTSVCYTTWNLQEMNVFLW